MDSVLANARYRKPLLNGLWLKILGFALTLIDHVGLVYGPWLDPGTARILRITGRAAFPLFVFLALEGVYYTKNYRRYFFRLLAVAVFLDAFAYGLRYGLPAAFGSLNPGNVFTDLALGTLVVYLLRRRDQWSWFAALPALYLVLSDFSAYHGAAAAFIPYGIASDYGTFGLCLFLAFYGAYELTFAYTRHKAGQFGVEYADLARDKLRLWLNAAAAVALVSVELVFDLVSQSDPGLALLPSLALGGMVIESWSTLAAIPLMFYDGRPGLVSRGARRALYLFYPVHLVLLWLISLAF